MKALVTGASGFIGSHLVETLLKKNLEVRVLARKKSNLRWLKDLPVEIVWGDLSHENLPRESLKGIDYLFHLAGTIQAISKKEYFEVNAAGTINLAQAVRETSPALKKFVFVSSQATGGPSLAGSSVREDDPPHPVSFYGQSKLAAETALLNFKRSFPIVILRPPTIYGPRETRVFKAFKMIKRGFAFAPGKSLKMVSFCYIDDLIEAILLAATKPQENGRIYNVCGEKPYEWLEFMEAIGKALNQKYRVYRIPHSVLFVLGALGEVYSHMSGRSSLFTWQKVKEFIQNSWVIDGTRIREELGWTEKISLEAGMARTAEWYREAGWL